MASPVIAPWERNQQVQVVKKNVSNSAVQVVACGRLCQIDEGSVSSLAMAQNSVQAQLGLQGQALQLRDVDGRMINTDEDLRSAMDLLRVPLQASLGDGAIHSMEMKRDEIAQMQWRLVREQFSAVSQSVHNVEARLQEFREELEDLKGRQNSFQERCKGEVATALGKESNDRIAAIQAVAGRADAVAQMLHAEQAQREVMVAQQKKQFESAFEVLEQERMLRMKDQGHLQREIDKIREDLRAEENTREAAVLRACGEARVALDKCNDISRSVSAEARNRELAIARLFEQTSETTQALERRIMRAQENAQNVTQETARRITAVEDANRQVGSHHSETYERFYSEIGRLDQRLTAVLDETESERGEIKANTSALQVLADRVTAFSEENKNAMTELEARFAQGHASHEDEMRNVTMLLQQFAKDSHSMNERIARGDIGPQIGRSMSMAGKEQQPASPRASQQGLGLGAATPGQAPMPPRTNMTAPISPTGAAIPAAAVPGQSPTSSQMMPPGGFAGGMSPMRSMQAQGRVSTGSMTLGGQSPRMSGSFMAAPGPVRAPTPTSSMRRANLGP